MKKLFFSLMCTTALYGAEFAKTKDVVEKKEAAVASAPDISVKSTPVSAANEPGFLKKLFGKSTAVTQPASAIVASPTSSPTQVQASAAADNNAAPNPASTQPPASNAGQPQAQLPNPQSFGAQLGYGIVLAAADKNSQAVAAAAASRTEKIGTAAPDSSPKITPAPQTEPAKTGLFGSFNLFGKSSGVSTQPPVASSKAAKNSAQPNAAESTEALKLKIATLEELCSGLNTSVIEATGRAELAEKHALSIEEDRKKALEQAQNIIKRLDAINPQEAVAAVTKAKEENSQLKQELVPLVQTMQEKIDKDPRDPDVMNLLRAAREKDTTIKILTAVLPIVTKYAEKILAYENEMVALKAALNQALVRADAAEAGKIQSQEQAQKVETELANIQAAAQVQSDEVAALRATLKQYGADV